MALSTPSLNSIEISTVDYVIKGYVYNKTLDTVFPYASVYCYSETTRELVQSAVADDAGYYALYVPAGDTYFVIADAAGQVAGILDNITPTLN